MKKLNKKIKFLIKYLIFTTTLLEALGFICTIILSKNIPFHNPQNYKFPENLIPQLEEIYDVDLGWDSNRHSKPGVGIFDISTFGDSFTFGLEVDDKDTWQNILAKESGHRVGNFGTLAHGLDQTALKIEKYIHKIQAKVILVSFSSRNINRTLNIFRPFYYPITKYHLTKPRFIWSSQKEQVRFVPNPVDKFSKIKDLNDRRFIENLAKIDFWYKNNEFPKASLPFSRIFLNKIFYQLLTKQKSINGKIEYSLLYGQRIPATWSLEPALRVHEFLLKKINDLTVDGRKKLYFIHMPLMQEVEEYSKNGKIPLSLSHLKSFCQKIEANCLSPLEGIEEYRNPKNVEKWFSPNLHYSPQGNKLIADFLHSQLR